ncbi:MAG: peptidoglycan DL-endopeptidase CwlO, partial [Solirubrobacteraceae bacterium]|nr:peptidoglycan DL-endopeptidase CwlO [Solirubrobacteraceae bacterium]
MTSPSRPRRYLALALGGAAALAVVAIAVLILGGGGGSAGPARPSSAVSFDPTGTAGSGRAARSGKKAGGRHGSASASAAASASATASASAHPIHGLVADPEAGQSFPQPAGSPVHAAAISPGRAALASTVSPGAPTDAQIKAELQQMEAAQKAADAAAKPGTISAAGTVTPPRDGPVVIARIIAGANAIATFPYVFGGGHASFVDTAYDCSGSL